MNMKTYSQILDDIAKDHIPADLNLAPTIVNQIQKRKGTQMRFKIKPITSVLFAAFAFTLLFFTVPGVKAAVQSWFGYIPGIGLISNGQVRSLEKPVSMTREGITVTVEQAILNQDQTTIVYSVEGLSESAQQLNTNQQYCTYAASLRLSDGSVLPASPSGVDSWATGYRHRLDTKAVTANQKEIVLELSCLFHTRPGSAPENWEIPLHFIVAPAKMTVYPVIEVTGSALSVESSIDEINKSEKSQHLENITLSIDRVVKMENRYLVYAALNWTNTEFNEVDLIDIPETLHLVDEKGKDISFTLISDDQTGIQYDQHKTVFAIKTGLISKTGKLLLKIDALLVNQPVNAEFTFDPGSNPQPGQQWKSGQEFQFGEQNLQIKTITFEKGNGYSFEMFSETGIRKAAPVDLDHPVISGYEGEGINGSFFSGFYYQDEIPLGPVTFTINNIGVKKNVAHLQAQWTPQETEVETTPIQTSVCLTNEKWKVSSKLSSSIPVNLPQRVLVYGPVDQSNLNGPWETYMMNLDGSNRKNIAEEKAVVSSDSGEAAYSISSQGVLIKDLSTGETSLLPGSQPGDFSPLWSPDGTKIVFMRGAGIFDLFITNLDGSDLHKITSSSSQEIPLAWLDNDHLLYSTQEITGVSIYRLDLNNGKVEEFSSRDIRSVSPDGKFIAAMNLTSPDHWQILLAEVGSDQYWALTEDNLSVLNPIWSPDGKWILATVLDSNGGQAMGAAINLATCDIIALPSLHDDVLAWLQ